jgi:hypothetical protein
LTTQQLLLGHVSSEDEEDKQMVKRKHVNLQIDRMNDFSKKKDSYTTILETSSPASSILKSMRKQPRLDSINEVSGHHAHLPSQ